MREQARQARVEGHAGDAERDHAPEGPAGPGLWQAQQLAHGGHPRVDELAEILAAHPAETDAIVAYAHPLFGNSFLAQVFEHLERQRLGEGVAIDAPAAARALVERGVHDENELTNQLFWLRYPALAGRRLSAGTPGAKEWLRLRNELVRPALQEAHARQPDAPPVQPVPAKPAAPAEAKDESEPARPAAGALLQTAATGAAQSASLDDRYYTQAGNSYVDTDAQGVARKWYRDRASANTCNATSLTMSLVSLAGSEEKAREHVVELLRRRGGVHAGASCLAGGRRVPVKKILEDDALLAQVQLEDLVTAAGIGASGSYKSITSRATLVEVANASGLVDKKKTKTFDRGRSQLANPKVREKARQLLGEGQRIVANTHNHYVYLVDARDDGIVIHDPAGVRMSKQGAPAFMSAGPVREKAGQWLGILANPKHRAAALRRVALNPEATAVFQRLVEIAERPAKERKSALAAILPELPEVDIGRANFYTPADMDEFDACLDIAFTAAETPDDEGGGAA